MVKRINRDVFLEIRLCSFTDKDKHIFKKADLKVFLTK